MNPADAKSDLMSLVEELKKAEADADDKKARAEQEAERILKSAREDSSNIIMRSKEEAVETKNDVLHHGKAETEKDAKKILDNAHADAKALRAKKMRKDDIAILAKRLLKNE